jgi:iron complex outermembrane recepter protein
MHYPKLVSRLLASSAIVATGGLSATALAQDADSSGLAEIIVTAQKREQSLQDVPVAVTALSQDSIQANRIENAANLTGVVPGLVARQTAGALGAISFSMRGVNANPSAPLQDKQISQYVDGVYIGGSRGTLGELMEVERIEALRGPQGTLFGRNSTAGAVNIVTRGPRGYLHFEQAVTVGNQGHLRTKTSVDTPQMGAFSAFATYIHDENRGDVRNLGAGVVWDRTNPFTNVGRQTSPKWVGGRNYENVFAALKFDNGGPITASYKFDWSKGNFVGDARVTPVINTVGERVQLPNGSWATFPVPNLIGNLLTQLIAAQPAGGGRYGPITLNPGDRRPDAANQAFATRGFQSVQGHNFTVNWQVSDDVTLKNTFGYRENEVFSGGASIAGLSGLEFNAGGVVPYATFIAVSTVPGFSTLPPANQGPIIQGIAASLAPIAGFGLYFSPYEGQSAGTHWQVSDELQLNYSTDKLNLTTGLLYFQSRTRDSGLLGFTPNIAFAPTSTTIALGDGSSGAGAQRAIGWTKSYAAYAQIEYQLTDQLGIDLGGRWTKDDKRGQFQDQGRFVGSRTGEGSITYGRTIPGEFEKSKFTYSIGANFKPADDFMLYGRYATGFLSGGVYADIAFAPENAKSWEVGLKSEFWDNRIRFNIAAYTVDYNNAQTTTSGRAINRADLPIAVIDYGDLSSKGIEADLTIAPVDGLTFGGNVGYTKNKIKNVFPDLAQGYTDFKPTGTPKWVGTTFAQYVSQPLWGDATLLLRADMIFQSKSRVLSSHQMTVDFPTFAPYEFIPSKQLVNGRVALRDMEIGGANVEIGLWGKNILDNKKPQYAFQYPYFLMTTQYEKARSYGVDMIVKFGREEEPLPPPPPPAPEPERG